MQNQEYNKLKGLSKYINRLLETGRWTTLGEQRQSSLKTALNRLAASVKRFVAKRKLVRVLGAAIMLLSVNANAQSFESPITGAFGMEDDLESYFNKPEFVDIDGDGDLDLFQVDTEIGTFSFQENIGTAEEPEFDESEENPFGLSPGTGPIMAIFGDLDNDGDFDMLTSSYEEGTAMYFENTGTATAPEFGTEVIMPFEISSIYIIMNDLVDIDDDSDLDLFISKYDEVSSELKVFFLENTGTAEVAEFSSEEVDPFGLTFSGDDYFTFIDFADIDDDGDLDFMRTEMYGKIVYYHENTGTASAPDFDAGSGLISPFDIDPLGLEQYFMAPSLVDIDADGDFDLFVSEYYGGGIFFYENRTIVVSIPAKDKWNDEIKVFPNPTVDNINIQTDLTSSDIQSIRITTIDGRQVYQTAQLVKSIDAKDFETGIYLLEVTNNEGQQMVLKFVKQ